MKRSIAPPAASRDSHNSALPPWPTAMGVIWSRTWMLKEVSQIVHAVAAWQDVVITQNGIGLCLELSGLELGFIGWNGRIHIALGSELRDELVAQGMAGSDPDDPDASMVVFDVRDAEGVDRAIWLLRLAYLDLTPTPGPCRPCRPTGRLS
jgi:hypothetical protein